MTMLDYLESEKSIDLLGHIPTMFKHIPVKPLYDSNNPLHNGNICFSPQVISVGICQDIGIVNLKKMSEIQRATWLSIVSSIVRAYMLECSKTVGKNSGLSYNMSEDCVCYRYHAKKFADRPYLVGIKSGIVCITWALQTYAILPNGNIIIKEK